MATFIIRFPFALKKKRISFIYKIKDEIHREHQPLLVWMWLEKRHCETALLYKSASHHSCNRPSGDLLSTYCAGTGTNNVAFGYSSNLFCHVLAWVSHPATLSHFNVSKGNTTYLPCFLSLCTQIFLLPWKAIPPFLGLEKFSPNIHNQFQEVFP